MDKKHDEKVAEALSLFLQLTPAKQRIALEMIRREAAEASTKASSTKVVS